MSLPKSFTLQTLRRNKQVAYYFRYSLHHAEFREVRDHNRLRGYFTAKPLYGKLTKEGQVDRSGGYNGEIAVLFIPSPARSPSQATVILTKIPKQQIALPNGKRNWDNIRQAAEHAVRTHLGVP